MPVDKITRLMNGRAVFVDVGARGGLPGHWTQAGSALQVVAFEADPTAAQALRALYEQAGARADVVDDAVWNQEGALQFHITRKGGCSSVLEPNRDVLDHFPDAARFDVMSVLDCRCTTMDAVMARLGARPDILKIDAQGGALPVLQGAHACLQSAVCAEIECEFTPLYKGQALFGEVCAHMAERGFDLIDINPFHWRRAEGKAVAGAKGQLMFCDALFLLSPESLADRLTALDEADRHHTILTALLACAVHGLDDLFLAYCGKAGTGPWGEVAESLRIGGRVASLPDFPGRSSLGTILKDLGDQLLRSKGGWGYSESTLGGRVRHPRSRLFQR